MANVADVVLQEINELIDKDRLVLPTLPEVALKAREVAEDPKASASDLAKVVNTDAAIATLEIFLSGRGLIWRQVASVGIPERRERAGDRLQRANRRGRDVLVDLRREVEPGLAEVGEHGCGVLGGHAAPPGLTASTGQGASSSTRWALLPPKRCTIFRIGCRAATVSA